MNTKVVGLFFLQGESHSVDVIGHFNQHVAHMKCLYDQKVLTADKSGRSSLFNTIGTNSDGSNENRNTQTTMNTTTKIIRERFVEYFFTSNQEWSEQQVEEGVSRFSLHSMKRGTATSAADMGAMDREIVRHGCWTNPTTMARYVENSLANKIKL